MSEVPLYKQEVHYNQHGMMILEGKGIQRLGDKWYPVQVFSSPPPSPPSGS